MSVDTPQASATMSVRKVALASSIGATIEWYDFFIYGTAAALVFNKLFFTNLPPAVGTLVALATFAVGYLARPLGAVIFGHLGDRLGRKKMLILTLSGLVQVQHGRGLVVGRGQREDAHELAEAPVEPPGGLALDVERLAPSDALDVR